MQASLQRLGLLSAASSRAAAAAAAAAGLATPATAHNRAEEVAVTVPVADVPGSSECGVSQSGRAVGDG
jgi:hypothetical protein